MSLNSYRGSYFGYGWCVPPFGDNLSPNDQPPIWRRPQFERLCEPERSARVLTFRPALC